MLSSLTVVLVQLLADGDKQLETVSDKIIFLGA